METVEIRCPKSILNVAKRAKKAKTAIYQALERVREQEAVGSSPATPTKKALWETTVPLFFIII